ncbi:hypothetical protein RRG08_029689 [Elysia crispata]|uniref:Uncharacterized protein n=1 Tax=Elysia crispata TaxID=231223 RepID=A0AAE0Y796_9GAST|nr:hypothetical protein RRG08_029689 [Elysia crispata]
MVKLPSRCAAGVGAYAIYVPGNKISEAGDLEGVEPFDGVCFPAVDNACLLDETLTWSQEADRPSNTASRLSLYGRFIVFAAAALRFTSNTSSLAT